MAALNPRALSVDALVREWGPVEALKRLEDAEAVCWKLQAEAAQKQWWGFARGCEAAAYALRADQFDLVARWA